MNATASTVSVPRRWFESVWPAHVTPAQRHSLVAGGLGWMLDSMDVALYTLILPDLVQHFALGKDKAGLLSSLTLASSAVGGFLFGFFADRVGRTRALMISILIYSLASGASGLSQTIFQLAIFRTVLGLGMGGEWTTGAALIAEAWPAAHRGKALGLMQSTWAIGEMIAVAVVFLVQPRWGWRAVFFVGVLPALFCLWIRRNVPESEIWLNKKERSRVDFAGLWRPEVLRPGVIATAMNACCLFGYWGLFSWIPAYLKLPVNQGGRGLALSISTAWLLVMGAGKWFGYTLFGVAADAAGRKRAYIFYLVAAAILVPLYGHAPSALWLLILGPFVAFFGIGYFSGFSALTSELFPTEVRATAMGLAYNVGRGFSAAAPWLVGRVADRAGFQAAFYVLAGFFLAAALLAMLLPETKGKELA